LAVIKYSKMRKPVNILKLIIAVLLCCSVISSNGQDPDRFLKRVEALDSMQYKFCPQKKLALFTGSSSIFMWKDIQSYFPHFNVINNGFGGSHFSDLLYFYDRLIIKHSPDFLFIYEGDNDVAYKKKVSEIVKTAKTIINRAVKDLPDTKIIIISAKPSIAREHLKNEYILLNKRLEKLCKRYPGVEFADIWSAMTDENGNVFKDIFLDDGLHMNKKGYQIWAESLSEFLN
jgi:lysophospholipase L1-like esterase